MNVLVVTGHDPLDRGATQAARSLGVGVEAITTETLFLLDADLVDADLIRLSDELLGDPLVHTVTLGRPAPRPGATVIEVAKRAGVTDSEAAALVVSAAHHGIDLREVITGRRHQITGPVDADGLTTLATRLLANAVIEEWALGDVAPHFAGRADAHVPPVEHFDVAVMSDDELAALNKARGMALDPAELDALRNHYRALARTATDAELEMFAQTWSEHCAHKTFRAHITMQGTDSPGDERSLLARLRAATDEIAAPWVVSAFVGNAGVVEFEPGHLLAVKVETHNHPSAVEPFGGANTGVGGVVRDVMAAPAHPIAVTDVLCFGPADTPIDRLPAGVLPPARIAEGVIAGVADYGNKLGVPNVAGAVLYDARYTANPLVFCGCVGRVYQGYSRITTASPGDRVVVVGGAAGRDGIRGATFSSMAMDATTGAVAGASVQIGDPIVEKLCIDLLDELIDCEAPLVRALTDCGAGGLSSAVGEMAEGIGADVDLALVPRKYPGLAPWEVWLSEAQERMVFAVAPASIAAVRAAADRHGVLFADIGSFTGEGRMIVRSNGELVVDLDASYLHDGRPRREMRADAAMVAAPLGIADPDVVERDGAVARDAGAVLDALLAHPNIASKAAVIHRYDFEVQAATIVRPLTGAELDGHSDGVVMGRVRDRHGYAVGIGVNPWFGERDPKNMALSVIDEAIRNVVAAGADPTRVALLDNFSWGNPRRPSTLGELVAAVDGCVEGSLLFGAPFVSGKDSLNNEYLGDDGVLHAIPPTLVITALAAVSDTEIAVTTDAKRADDLLVLVGATRDELWGSHLDKVLGLDPVGSVPGLDGNEPARYRGLHEAVKEGIVRAAHDLSEGGLAVAVAEMSIAGRLGAEVDLDAATLHDGVVALFSESNGRLLVEVDPADLDRLRELVPGAVTPIGRVRCDDTVMMSAGPLRIERTVAALRATWSS